VATVLTVLHIKQQIENRLPFLLPSTAHFFIVHSHSLHLWYLRKLMVTSNLFLGIDSSGGIDTATEMIPRRNRLLL
jgi:hypothetical protein